MAQRQKGEWKWYLPAGVLGILGGIATWFVLRKKDKELATSTLYFSIAVVVLEIVITAIFVAIAFASIIAALSGMPEVDQVLSILSGGTL